MGLRHSHRWRGKKEEEKILTEPLTFVLSRRGREEKEEKILRKPLTLTLSRKVERELKGIHLIKSILFVFVNFGVFKV
jgi:hypothetical protein